MPVGLRSYQGPPQRLTLLVSNESCRKCRSGAGTQPVRRLRPVTNTHKRFGPEQHGQQRLSFPSDLLGRSHRRQQAAQPTLARDTLKTFVWETNNTEGTRHLNIVTPQLLIAVLGEEQLRCMWARLGPRDANSNGNSYHGDHKERPTKGITNMRVSKGGWRWIMQGDATTVPALFPSQGSTAALSTYRLVCFAAAGG